MALKRNSNEQYVKNAAMMHDNASYVPVPTGVENPLPVSVKNFNLQLAGMSETLTLIYRELRLLNIRFEEAFDTKIPQLGTEDLSDEN